MNTKSKVDSKRLKVIATGILYSRITAHGPWRLQCYKPDCSSTVEDQRSTYSEF